MKRLKLLFIYTLTIVGFTWNTASGQSNDEKITKNLEILFNVFKEINLLYVDPVNPDSLIKSAAWGMSRQLDPYTEYFSQKDMEEFEIRTTGKYGGIGAVIKQRKGVDYIMIAEPYEGSPADKAGLKIDDRITAINGESAKGFSSEKVSSLLKGDPETTFTIEIESEADSTRKTLTIKRERISIPSVSYSGVVAPQTGYISLTTFAEGAADEIAEALNKLKKEENITSLVLDFRNNGGGLISEAVKIVGLFIPHNSKVVSTKGKLESAKYEYLTTNQPIDTTIRLAVMINGNSASASEIVAGALQDYDRAVICGQRSFGKGLVQSTRAVGHNSFLKITTAKYYIPSGRCIQAINYSKRNSKGEIEHIPDSLINEFKTAKGRKVYDGGGIMPDLRIAPSYHTLFTLSLYSQGYIEDFARIYYKKYPLRGTETGKRFTLTDEEYNEFIEYAKDKKIDYKSETDAAVKMLRKIATREKYLERIEQQIKALEELIKTENIDNLTAFRSEIQPLIESEIILRHHYRRGEIRHSLGDDNELNETLKVLNNPDELAKYLSKDTDRK